MGKTLFSNESLLPLNVSTSSFYTLCILSGPSPFIFTAFSMINIFLLPLFIFILHHGLHQWWKKRSASSAASMSHSDCFTYHMAIMELVGVFGSFFGLAGIYGRSANIWWIGLFPAVFTWNGQLFCHALTCAERYLAVVYPVTYMRLRNERGVRIRNVSIGCVWLLSFIFMYLTFFSNFSIIQEFSLLVSAFMVISFCSVSILRVLLHPGPGERAGDRERVDKAKRRAFCTIVVILGVLMLRLACGLARIVLSVSHQHDHCTLISSELILNFPSRLVLPFLFLHRTGRLMCFERAQSHD